MKFSLVDFRNPSKKKGDVQKESIEDYLKRGGNIVRVDTREALKQKYKEIICIKQQASTKLTQEQINEIVKSNLPFEELAYKYNVSYHTIRKTKHRHTWENVKV